MNNTTKCTIVMYHYVRNMYETEYPEIKGLLIDKFIGQLNYIGRKYSLISMDDYLKFLNGSKTIPDNSCVLTFDDGLKDHYTTVYPILRERNLPGNFYLITQPLSECIVPAVHKAHFILAKIGSKIFSERINNILKEKYNDHFREYYIDDKIKKDKRKRWDDNLTANLKYTIAAMPTKIKNKIIDRIFYDYFDNEKNFCAELYLSWSEIREMMANGMSFGSHGHSHPELSRLSEKEQFDEISISKEILDDNLKTEIQLFSYPYGSYNGKTVKILKKLGFIGSIISTGGVNSGQGLDPYTLKRVNTNDLPFN